MKDDIASSGPAHPKATATASRGEGRRSTIISVAIDLFYNRGFEDVTIDDVAREAHASKQTIYRFFGDRNGLIGEVLRCQLDEAIAPLEAEAARGEPLERLRNVGAAYQTMAFDARYLRMYRYLIGSVNSSTALGHTFNELVTDRVTATVEPILAEAIGVQRASVETDAFLGALQGKEFNRALAGAHPRPTRVAELLDIAMAIVARSQQAP